MSRRRETFVVLAILVLMLANVVVFLPLWTGDAEITQVYAENAARGRWFEFNPGEPTAGVTSPAWLLTITALHRLGGASFAAYATKATSLFLLVLAGHVVLRIGRIVDAARASALPLGLVACGLLLLDPTIAAHALTGLEGALAIAIVAVGTLAILAPPATPMRRVLAWAAIFAAAVLTRPETPLLLAAAMLVAPRSAGRSTNAREAIAAMVIGALVAAPWFLLQRQFTGELLPTSGVSRLLLARRSAWHLGPLALHGRLLLRLGGTYAPFALGAVLAIRHVWRRPESPLRFPVLVLAVQVAIGLSLDVALIGGRGSLRYFLPCFPAYFLLGALGLALAFDERTSAKLRVLLPCGVAWMMLAFVIDFGLRARDLGDYVPMRAHLAAPRERTQNSDALIEKLRATGPLPIRLAVTEVEMRRALDERFVVLSLDGRVDPALVQLIDRRTGCPDVARYLVLRRADYVHAERACDCPESVPCTLERSLAEPGAGPGKVVHTAGLDFVFTGWDSTWRVAGPTSAAAE